MARSPKAYLLASLIEHESCVSLKHSRCWDPTSRLKSHREEGAGLFQLTRAYHVPSGELRFDTIKDLRFKYPKYLKNLGWHNVYTRPDLQIRAGILLSKEVFLEFIPYSYNVEEALAFADAAYNGGSRGVNNERRACKLDPKCDHTRWFNHTERFCLKSRTPLYGNRSACDINRHHVRDVMLIRSSKYKPFFM